MAGTRTAPSFAVAPTSRQVTLHFIDASGDLFTQALIVPVDATDAQVQTIASTYQAASNASLYAITDQLFREGDADPDNAVAAYRASVKDGINLQFRDVPNRIARAFRVIAPVAATMQGNQDIPLLSSTELTNLITGLLAVWDDYDFQRAQYTERRERTNNPVIK